MTNREEFVQLLEKEIFLVALGVKPFHNLGLWRVEIFNNLALWGEKKFVGELKRTYKFQRGVYCHTEDNSPKYRMVCNGVGLESQTHRNNCGEYRKTVITRSDKRHSNLILLIPHLEIKDFGPPASGGHDKKQITLRGTRKHLHQGVKMQVLNQ